MCAPLTRADGKPFGVIQLDTQDRSKKFTKEDLALLCGVANQASIALENARLIDDAVKQESVRKDLDLAHKVQAGFLPSSLPSVPGYDFFGYYEAAKAVGGDYYGYVPLPGGRICVAVGDVAGKGVAASLLMAKLSSDIRFSLLTEASPAAALGKLNQLLYEFTSKVDRFVTVIAAVLDPATHEATLVSAGHEEPLIYRPATGELLEAMPNEVAGLAVGILDDHSYHSHRITLEPGDRLLMFTDGVIDSRNAAEQRFKLEGVRRTLAGVKGLGTRDLVERLVAAVNLHAAGREEGAFDDLTVVALGRTGA
jgi:serine phosphatase RsbU (regulator of sigma subunit)